jgi:ABC-type lipoprotein release transport system permease subunit
VLPLALNGELDRRVMTATMLVSVLTALISGALPALRATRISPGAVLKMRR